MTNDLESRYADEKTILNYCPKKYWLIMQPDLPDDDDYKVIHTTDIDVYPDAVILGEFTRIKHTDTDTIVIKRSELEAMRKDLIRSAKTKEQLHADICADMGYNQAIDDVLALTQKEK